MTPQQLMAVGRIALEGALARLQADELAGLLEEARAELEAKQPGKGEPQKDEAE